MRRISLPPRDDGAIEGRVTIQRSIDDVFRFYGGFRNLPRFLGDVTAIEPLGRATYRWTIQGPLGVRVKWKVKMTEEDTNELIRYETVTSCHSGRGVTFEERRQAMMILNYVGFRAFKASR